MYRVCSMDVIGLVPPSQLDPEFATYVRSWNERYDCESRDRRISTLIVHGFLAYTATPSVRLRVCKR